MSEIKVNKISPRSGTAFTLGDSGDTFTIPSGATINNQGTAVNFGATGSASWVTTVKTSSFTAVAGEGYFVNTTSGAITVTLPASPAAGAVVAVKDYANTWDTNNCILGRNGSNIGGNALNSTLSIEGLAVTLVFVDATKGWLVTDSGLQDEAPGPEFITATGGTITIADTDFKVHTFTGPGTLTVCSVGNAAGSNTVDYMVVAGGASGGFANGGGGGGGAGGLRYAASTYCNPTPSGGNAASALPVSAQGYPIAVGGGGAAKSGSPDYKRGDNGSVSSFDSITSAGGGGGGGGSCSGNGVGAAGGSGGGGGKGPASPGQPGGAGDTPPVSPAQGRPGGIGGSGAPAPENTGGGGGGHAVTGINASPGQGGSGGAGSVVAINGSSTSYGGGGGGNHEGQPGPAQGAGGAGGGGPGGQTGGPTANIGGGANTGGGGGGADSQPNSGISSGAGGSGIVIIRYKFQ